jgi:hypothetical protein
LQVKLLTFAKHQTKKLRKSFQEEEAVAVAAVADVLPIAVATVHAEPKAVVAAAVAANKF